MAVVLAAAPAYIHPIMKQPPPGKNRLSLEKSPYLLQHADNPVDWYPWGQEAFEKAGREDKPIFLSIGYSTCHWCHVMEHESFEDSEVAALMNDAFVNVKVDREERPDIDAVYMSVCQMMTGSGGWPLSVILTPKAKPFFAGTYIPKTARFGRAGMLELVPQIVAAWRARRGEIEAASARITSELERISVRQASAAGPGIEVLERAYQDLAGRFDGVHGGFGHAPKFPSPHNLLFLLRYWKRTGENRALEMVETTLRGMASGGIWDHVGFGFHRYSTDEKWFAPHFEKMMYDQALLAMAYTEAFLATGNEPHRRTAEAILDYALRDMSDPSGAFYSAEDADSEGVEGKFYLWTHDELTRLLDADDARLVVDLFGVEPAGNFSGEVPGGNILYLRRPLDAVARELSVDAQELRDRLEKIRRILYDARRSRVRPQRDDKILTDWNGLMIAALSKAASAFDEPRYASSATKAAEFLLGTMRAGGGFLHHRFRDGEAAVTGNLDDYACLAWGLVELYQATFEVEYLQRAVELADEMVALFADPQVGGFYFAAAGGERLIVRTKDVYDGAAPSGNSTATYVLIRLARLTGESRFEDEAEKVARAFHHELTRAPSGFAFFMSALELAAGPSTEVVVVGDPKAPDTLEMIRTAQSIYAPAAVLLFKSTADEGARLSRLAPFTANHASIDGRATAYACRNQACGAPTTDAGALANLLQEHSIPEQPPDE
jgi:uncharacterized protein YyaL (SSP411 family)